MPTANRRKRLIRVAATLIAVAAVLMILIYADAALTAKVFFGIENAWTGRWPVKSQRGALEALEPALRRMKLLRPARIEVEPGVSFYLDSRDLIPRSILVSGYWQPELWAAMLPTLHEGSVFLDVGAHIGYFSIKASRKVGKTGRVVAFDPNPEILKLLRDNVAANHESNVVVEPIACTDRDQMLTFYSVPSTNTGASSLAEGNAEPWSTGTHSYQVHGRPIDDVVRELNLSRVDAVKIDVEGAELSVLRGALETLKRFHPKIIIEVSPAQLANFKTTPDDLFSLIKSAGYNRGRPLNPEQADWEWTLADTHNFSSSISVDSPDAASHFVRGVYSGSGTARWTDANFTVALLTPAGARTNGATLSLKFFVAAPSIKALKSLTLSTRIGDAALAPQTYASDGIFEYKRDVPASVFDKDIVEVNCSLDKYLQTNGEKMGVLIMSAGLQAK